MQNPCPVCSRGTVTPWPYRTTSAPTILGNDTSNFVSMITSSWGIPVVRQYYTWREALLVALNSPTSTMKPRIERDGAMWKVTTFEQPIPWNFGK